MATATFRSFADFKAGTSPDSPRYYIMRPEDQRVLRVMGFDSLGKIAHIYTMGPEEKQVPVGDSADPWFVDAIEVQDFASP